MIIIIIQSPGYCEVGPARPCYLSASQVSDSAHYSHSQDGSPWSWWGWWWCVNQTYLIFVILVHHHSICAWKKNTKKCGNSSSQIRFVCTPAWKKYAKSSSGNMIVTNISYVSWYRNYTFKTKACKKIPWIKKESIAWWQYDTNDQELQKWSCEITIDGNIGALLLRTMPLSSFEPLPRPPCESNIFINCMQILPKSLHIYKH